MFKLPTELAARLKEQLGDQGFQDYLACLTESPKPGLRLNTIKGAATDLADLLPFPLEPVPWAPAGYTYSAEARPGKLPYYQAGLYYLQEPSAMAPAAALQVKRGERVLDLCAAPGGKTTQLAAALAGTGILVANDNSPKRVKSLIWNLEHWGAINCIILNEEPDRLVPVFRGFFDKILVDAPCSGEGMLRREPKALRSWQAYAGEACRKLQDALLAQAAEMLAPGGWLVYSTCTFNPLENEGAVAAFIEHHPRFRLKPLPHYKGWQPGRVLKDCRQLWPHLTDGEGQFLALLEKKGGGAAGECTAKPGCYLPGALAEARPDEPGATAGKAATIDRGHTGNWIAGGREHAGKMAAAERAQSRRITATERGHTGKMAAAKQGHSGQSEELKLFRGFMEENFIYPLGGPFAVYGGHVYQIPPDLPDFAGLRVCRPGWHLGMVRNQRFYPSQPLAMGMETKQMKRRLDLDPGGGEAERYLRGETLIAGGERGWTMVTLGGFPLGFGKQAGDFLKNEYAGGWRVK